MISLKDKSIKPYLEDKVVKVYFKDKVVYLQGLPPGFTRLNYLQSDGNQAIDTGFISSGTYKVECTFATNNDVTASTSLFGVRNESPVRQFGSAFFIIDESLGLRLGSASATVAITTPALKNTRYKLETSVSGNIVRRTLTDVTLSTSVDNSASFAGSTITDDTLHLFGNSVNGAIIERISAKIYEFKVWDNNVLVRDFIPMLDDADRPCMYCMATKTTYYDVYPTGGDFTYG